MTAAKRRSDGTVAVWGTFDLDNFGDQLYPRITEDELLRRLPGWNVRTYAPFGWERPCRMDGGFLAEPLGPWEPARAAQLARAADLTLVCGDPVPGVTDRLARAYGVDHATLARRAPWLVDGLGAELERRHPVVWNAVGAPRDLAPEHVDVVRAAVSRRPYVAVRDQWSARELHAIGVERDVDVVPDIGFLMHRLVRTEPLRTRVAYFRHMGWYPAARPALIVQGDRSALPHAREIAKVVRWATEEVIRADVVLLETGPCHGDGEFADVIAEHLDPAHTHRLPSGLPPEDVLAAVNGATATIATSFHATLASALFGRRWALLNLGDTPRSRGLAETLQRPEQHATTVGELAEAVRVAFPRQPDPHQYAKLLADVDRHFDTVAELADRAWRAGGGSSEHRWAEVRRENEQLRAAYRATRLRLAAERRRLIDYAPQTEQVSPEELHLLRHHHAELERLRHTKLLRWSAPARKLYSRLTGREF